MPEDAILHDWNISRKNLEETWDVFGKIEIFDTSVGKNPRPIATKEDGRFTVHVPEDEIPEWAIPIIEHGRRMAAARAIKRKGLRPRPG